MLAPFTRVIKGSDKGVAKDLATDAPASADVATTPEAALSATLSMPGPAPQKKAAVRIRKSELIGKDKAPF
jgi:hypothetical protein